MILIGIGDGLGNQMFQYAFYHAMRTKYTQSTILFDKYFYGSVNTHNGIELHRIFDLDIPFCTRKQALSLCDYHLEIKKQCPLICFLWGARKALKGAKESYLSIDDATAYYKEVFELNPLRSYYLRGNWINEQYFKQYKEEIVTSFSFPEIVDEENILIANDIKTSLSVSLHVRAGDFLNNPNFVQLGLDYYNTAIDYIKSKEMENLRLFVFSDDRDYAERMFASYPNKRIVCSNTGVNSFRDMQLMSMCKHNVISNSTFGFWGAYLNQNTSKIVVAPSKASVNCRNPFACKDWLLV